MICLTLSLQLQSQDFRLDRLSSENKNPTDTVGNCSLWNDENERHPSLSNGCKLLTSFPCKCCLYERHTPAAPCVQLSSDVESFDFRDKKMFKQGFEAVN